MGPTWDENSDRPQPWKVSDNPETHIEPMNLIILRIEIKVTKIEGSPR